MTKQEGVISIARKKVNRVCYVPEVEKIGIYLIENAETKNRYIGSTVNIKNRLIGYERAIRLGWSINRRIDADIEAGHNKFFFSVLEVFEDGTITNAQLSRIERDYINAYGTTNEYNERPLADRHRLRWNQILYHTGNVRR